jgi:hypothetical protein
MRRPATFAKKEVLAVILWYVLTHNVMRMVALSAEREKSGS